MTPIAWIVLIVVAVIVVAAIVLALRQRSRMQLQQRFGPEYDRAVERTGNRRAAEQELSQVAQRRDKLDIRDLDPDSRTRFSRQWNDIQAHFVDAPGEAVGAAATLITAVMRERGYPVDDFDQRASLVAADHADVVEHYRKAQLAFDRHRNSGQADTEDLRQAFVHYRYLFNALVEPVDARDTSADRRTDASTDTRTDTRTDGRTDVDDRTPADTTADADATTEGTAEPRRSDRIDLDEETRRRFRTEAQR
jgi:hypothetical protein